MNLRRFTMHGATNAWVPGSRTYSNANRESDGYLGVWPGAHFHPTPPRQEACHLGKIGA